MDTETTKVIFRIFKEGGDCIAIFPELPGSYDPFTCSCYMHTGQHSTCSPMELIQDTWPAYPHNTTYPALMSELEIIGYNLEIIKKHRQSHVQARIKEINRIR
jgi:hypothetical protein